MVQAVSCWPLATEAQVSPCGIYSEKVVLEFSEFFGFCLSVYSTMGLYAHVYSTMALHVHISPGG
jgi:hypothetical protein